MEKVETKRIKEVIIQNLQQGFDYVRTHEEFKVKDVYPTEFEEIWLLWKRFSLSDLREWSSLSENEEYLLLSILDSLSTQRRVKVFRAEISKKDCWNVNFVCEVGRSLRVVDADVGWRTVKNYFYSERPMTKVEFERAGIEKPSERVKEMRARRDKHFESVFGRKDFDIERRLIHDELVANVEVASTLRRIQKSMKVVEKQLEKEGNV